MIIRSGICDKCKHFFTDFCQRKPPKELVETCGRCITKQED